MPVDTSLEKPLPNNLDAERSVLGAILLDNHALNPAIEHLRPEDFFLDQHRRVFTQMIALGEVGNRTFAAGRFFSGPAPARVHADDRAGRGAAGH